MCVIAYPTEARANGQFKDVLVTNQGRLLKVLVALVASMTVGALVLFTLEGRPIKPMAFSLSRQTQLRSVEHMLGTEPGVGLAGWDRIEIDTRAGQGELSVRDGVGGTLAMEYHFVISDGSTGKDGEIYATRRWTKQLSCYLPGGSGLAKTIRICLLTDGQDSGTTGRQARQLEDLVSTVAHYCQIEPQVIWNGR